MLKILLCSQIRMGVRNPGGLRNVSCLSEEIAEFLIYYGVLFGRVEKFSRGDFHE
ncbi:hypothetical protein AB205_0028410 [Aquarana catesbeiana]|uniref:Uncharacterized protein n=1 Tax=Aquarana catesbeiana TaxID=8400 RepID=A0A2G9S6T3_AQUCT|nr:hypothetical protein AB205_0028410 [Aquarana catesbeiana]